ncbi:MAG: hypothetical protein HYY16_07510 [Planctomycetes bacterium]|nr:hypothetical protein [Planctomycetota bacterium]
MNRLAPLLLVFAAACGHALAPAARSGSPDRSANALDWGDLDKLAGQTISIEGRFDHIGGEHGVVTLDSGLNVYLPNIHLYLRGKPWFDYLNKRVVVRGLLRTEGCEIPGYTGPSLISVDSFRIE